MSISFSIINRLRQVSGWCYIHFEIGNAIDLNRGQVLNILKSFLVLLKSAMLSRIFGQIVIEECLLIQIRNIRDFICIFFIIISILLKLLNRNIRWFSVHLTIVYFRSLFCSTLLIILLKFTLIIFLLLQIFFYLYFFIFNFIQLLLILQLYLN